MLGIGRMVSIDTAENFSVPPQVDCVTLNEVVPRIAEPLVAHAMMLVQARTERRYKQMQ